MGLGSSHFDTTDSAMLIPAKWSNRVNDFFRAQLKAASFFEDWSADVADGGNIVYVPNITEMTAQTKSAATEVVLQDNTDSKITLTINTHKHVAFMIEDVVASKFKSSYRAQDLYAQNAGYTTAGALEDALLLLIQGFAQVVGSSAAALADSNIRAAIAYLDAANVPQEDRAFFLHPNVVWNQLMGIDRYTLVQNVAGANNPVLKGQTHTLYGIPVITTSRLEVHLGHRDGGLAHKSAIAFACANPSGMSGPNHVRLQTDYILQHLGTLVVADVIFGVIENRDTSGVWIKAKSS
jgi:hypothetical protein